MQLLGRALSQASSPGVGTAPPSPVPGAAWPWGALALTRCISTVSTGSSADLDPHGAF